MGKRLDRARNFIRGVKGSDPDPIYFLYGDEAYMLDKAVEAVLEEAAPDGGLNDFNFDTYRGRDATGEAVREAAEMLPMMADRRIVLVRDVQEMPMSELEKLEDYFEAPSDKTCLILHANTAGNKGIDGRRGPIRKLKKAANHCEFESLYESEVGDVVRKQAAEKGLSLDREASAFLVQAVGTDIATLARSLEKIDLYVGESNQSPKPVSRKDVEAVTAETRVRDVFDLTDALGDRNYQESLAILDNMLLSGKNAIPILYMIARHFRLVDKLHDPEVRRKDKYERASELGVPHFFVGDYGRHARKFTAREVAAIRERLLETDQALKSSGLDDRTLLESLLYDICFRD